MDDTVTDKELLYALRTEADLCRNDGANDIAVLLDAAADRIVTLGYRRSNMSSKRTDMTLDQVGIALAKLYSGTRPGDDMWCELYYEALEYALGHPVERKPDRWLVFGDYKEEQAT